jgi:ankyrin repeat protein
VRHADPGAPQPPQKDIDAFSAWMENAIDSRAKGPKAGYVPIQRLNRTEYAASVKALVGVDVNEKDGQGATALHIAAGYGYLALGKMLIAKGADVNAKAKDGSTPIQMAVQGGARESVELLAAKGAEINAFAAAALGRA